MGFYLDLEPVSPGGIFKEQRVAPAFFSLFAIGGFALTCMFLAASSLLRDMARSGSVFDLAILAGIGLFLPLYLLIGVKLFLFRKFIEFAGDELRTGFYVGKKPWVLRRRNRNQIQTVELVNQRPSENVAPRHHGDNQYYIRGHWRLVLKTNSNKLVLDRHTEKEALEPLYEQLVRWTKPPISC